MVWQGFVTLIVLIGAVAMLFPIAFMITTSLKTSGNTFLLPIRWIPGLQFVPEWKNFPDALNFKNWTVVYKNTFVIAGGNMIGDTLSACLVA